MVIQMKSSAYWKRRFEETAAAAYTKAEEYIAALNREYTKANINIQNDLNAFYTKFATDNKMTFAEAKKVLSKNELQKFKYTLQEFKEKTISKEFQQEIANASMKTQITRLESLQMQIKGRADVLKTGEMYKTEELLSKVYENSYYRNVFNIQQGLGFGSDFALLNDKKILKAVNEPWAESDFKSRTGADKAKLISGLRSTMVQGFIRGDSLQTMSKNFVAVTGTSKNRADKIIRSETAHVTEAATYESYRETGVEKYDWLATLDTKTCENCAMLDGKTFEMSEYSEGETAPPLHANDRCTTVPNFGDNAGGTRVARNDDGSTYKVPADMEYNEWRAGAEKR